MKKTILFLLAIIPLISYSQDKEFNDRVFFNKNVFIGLHTQGKFGEGNALSFEGGLDVIGDPIYIYRHQVKANYSDLRINIADDNNGDDRFTIGNKPSRTGRSTWEDWFTVTNQGRVGINRVPSPRYELDVNGTIFGKQLKTSGDIIIGDRVSSSSFGEITRLTITPYHYTTGPWTVNVREQQSLAYLDFNYGPNKNLLTIQHQGFIGLGVANPTERLEVNGTIRAKEVKIEATGWADFVFAEGYQLPKLSEVENHIKENKHLPNIPSESEVKENGISVGEMQTKLLQKIEELTLYVIQLDKDNEALKEKVALLEKN